MRHMELTTPGVATLRRDPDQRALGDAETADAALAASGDGRAFERLYRAHVARVHSLVRRMIGPDSADDIAQDVFVRADRKSTRLNSSHTVISYAVFCLKKKKKTQQPIFNKRYNTSNRNT